ncbi:unnamed protein product [Calypogeia fissa]
MAKNIMDLSDDNISGIFSHLPFSSLFGAQHVCQRWCRLAPNTESKQLTSWCILSCPAKLPSSSKEKLSRLGSFRREFSRSGSVMKALSRSSSSRRGFSSDNSGNFHVVMFDPSRGKWLKVKNPFGYKGPCASSARELLWVPSTGGYSGLVCVFEWEEESCHNTNTYWVGNPITNDWQSIAGPSPWRGVHQLVVDPITKTYKIISIRWEQLMTGEVPTGVWRVTIYDSTEQKWRYGAHWNVPLPPAGMPYCLSSRTHTASDKMMYLLMYRAGRLMDWETYTEIQILGYDIQKDEFKFVTPLSRFDQCVEFFEPTSCRDWPVHLVLKSDELSANSAANPVANSAVNSAVNTGGCASNQSQVEAAATTTTPQIMPPDPAAVAVAADKSCPAPAPSPAPAPAPAAAAAAADQSCPVLLVTCSTSSVRKRRFQKLCHLISNVIHHRPRAFHREFENKIGIFEFNPGSGNWDVKEKSSSLVTGEFYSRDRVFHCAGDRLEHLYYAHVDEHQSVVVYNAKKDDFSTWSRLPPLGDEYGGCIAKNYHSLGSFVPRLDATPYKIVSDNVHTPLHKSSG